MTYVNFGQRPTHIIDDRGMMAKNPPEDWQALAEANQRNFDRREKSRKSPPKTSIRIKAQRILNSVAYKIYASRIYQLIFGLMTLASIFLLWFTLSERISLINQNYENIGRMGELESELIRTQQLWSSDRMDEISESIRNADQRRVFADYQNLATWLFEKNTLANQLSLDFSYQLGESKKAQIDNTLEVPIAITLKAGNRAEDNSFNQLMTFTRYIVSSSWYVDIQEASIENNNNDIKEMKLRISIWVHGQVKANE